VHNEKEKGMKREKGKQEVLNCRIVFLEGEKV
jgi:hypothetical protein